MGLERIHIDGKDLSKMDLTGKTLVYSGGNVGLVGAHFFQTEWVFEGAAWRTMALLALLEAGDPQVIDKVMAIFRALVPADAWRIDGKVN